MTDEYVRGENEEGESASFVRALRPPLVGPTIPRPVSRVGGVGGWGGTGMVWYGMGVHGREKERREILSV